MGCAICVPLEYMMSEDIGKTIKDCNTMLLKLLICFIIYECTRLITICYDDICLKLFL